MTTLARLAFWAPTERLADFETAYQSILVPLLQRHALEVSTESERFVVDGVFSRIFAVETPAAVSRYEHALRHDPDWIAALRRLGRDLGSVGPDAFLPYECSIYQTAIGPGRSMPAGPGFRQGGWQSFAAQDGFPASNIRHIYQDVGGRLWFATSHDGAYCYDGVQVTAYSAADGLASGRVEAVLEDRAERLWFATYGGLSRWDGDVLETFTTADGLPGNTVRVLLEDGAGRLWCGGDGWLVRWDDGKFVPLAEGLVKGRVEALLEDGAGHLWVGTEEGLSCWDGAVLETFTTADGLVAGRVRSLLEDGAGHLWVGTYGAVSRWNGEGFEAFAGTEDFAANGCDIASMLEDGAGCLWFGSRGVSRWDGHTWQRLNLVDRLGFDRVFSICQDRRGHLWFAVYGGGVCRWDGLVVQTLCRRDGLASDLVRRILQDQSGDFWIATEGGLTRYRAATRLPAVRITEVSADRQYGPVDELTLTVSHPLIVVEFQGYSSTTPPERLAYVYRLQGHQSDWQPLYTTRITYQDLPEGDYTFQVRAVDRDLNYSDPATLRLTVEPDLHQQALSEVLSAGGPADDFVGESEALHRVQYQLAEVAPIDVTVLILGETGTGKGLAARTLHRLSERRHAPFVLVNCGAIPDNLVESELFGHEKGAFTGAVARKLGKVELAEGGTLFLDEIGDMTLDAQTRLLHLLEEGAFERVGGTRTLTADVRVVAATNRLLKEMVAQGHFREDLYFRLEVFLVHLPPLRQRREDIPFLAVYFMERMAAHLDKPVSRIAPAALELLQGYAWPGNVRELEHAIQRAVIVCRGGAIDVGDVGLETGQEAADSAPLVGQLTPEEYERRYLEAVLEQTNGVIKGPQGAAAQLGMPASTLRHRLRKLGIQRA